MGDPGLTARRAADGRRIPAALWAAALLVAGLAAERLWLIPVHVSFNPNEGWNAFQASRALGGGGALYPPPGALTGDNYPPLSFLVVGWVARLAHLDPIVAGRLLAVAALCATAAAVAWAVARLQPRPGWAPAAGAVTMLAFAATQFRDYLALDDPQWLAHALMTPALALVVPDRPGVSPRAGRTALAAALVVLGALVKHNLVALPVAITVWLVWRHRRAFVVWAAVGAGLGALAVGAMLAAYGPDPVTDILFSPRQGSWMRMARSAAGPLLASVPLMVAAWGLLRLRRADARLEPVILFIALAVPLGVFQRSGQGVNFNAHFEALVALSVGGAVVLSHALASGPPGAARRTAACLALPFVALVPLAALAAVKEARSLPMERRAWAAMEARLASAPGEVACQTPALCFWAGRRFTLDMFLTGQRLAATGDAPAVLRALDAGGVTLVQRDPERRRKAGEAANPLLALLDRRAAVVFAAEDGRRLQTFRP